MIIIIHISFRLEFSNLAANSDLFPSQLFLLPSSCHVSSPFRWGIPLGNSITVGDQTVVINHLIADGGYAFVYHATDVASGVEYALKKVKGRDEGLS